MVNTGKNFLSYGHKCRAVTRCVSMKGNKISAGLVSRSAYRYNVSPRIPVRLASCLARLGDKTKQHRDGKIGHGDDRDL